MLEKAVFAFQTGKAEPAPARTKEWEFAEERPEGQWRTTGDDASVRKSPEELVGGWKYYRRSVCLPVKMITAALSRLIVA